MLLIYKADGLINFDPHLPHKAHMSPIVVTPSPSRGTSLMDRGVQYVHWVMHKCIMVKVGVKRIPHEVCKKQVNFSKTGGGFFKVVGNNNFRETVGKCTETGEIGGKFEICGR